jgi:hypothetical protein
MRKAIFTIPILILLIFVLGTAQPMYVYAQEEAEAEIVALVHQDGAISLSVNSMIPLSGDLQGTEGDFSFWIEPSDGFHNTSLVADIRIPEGAIQDFPMDRLSFQFESKGLSGTGELVIIFSEMAQPFKEIKADLQISTDTESLVTVLGADATVLLGFGPAFPKESFPLLLEELIQQKDMLLEQIVMLTGESVEVQSLEIEKGIETEDDVELIITAVVYIDYVSLMDLLPEIGDTQLDAIRDAFKLGEDEEISIKITYDGRLKVNISMSSKVDPDVSLKDALVSSFTEEGTPPELIELIEKSEISMRDMRVEGELDGNNAYISVEGIHIKPPIEDVENGFSIPLFFGTIEELVIMLLEHEGFPIPEVARIAFTIQCLDTDTETERIRIAIPSSTTPPITSDVYSARWEISEEVEIKGLRDISFVRQFFLDLNTSGGEVSEGQSGWYDEGSEVSVTAPSNLEIDGRARLTFKGWSEATTSKESKVTINIDAPQVLKANWEQEFYLEINSEFGDPQGGGWFDDGSITTFSVSSPVGIVVQQVFQGWVGDYQAGTASATILMDSPKTITAVWSTDYTQLIIVIGIVLVTAAIIGFAMIRQWKK